MKNSIFKSFRFEIVVYSLLSLVYTLLTEAFLYFGFYLIYRVVSSNKIYGRAQYGILADRIVNNENSLNYAPNDMQYNLSGNGIIPTKGFIILIIIVAFLFGVFLFTIYFLFLTKKFGTYLEQIAGGITEIAAGNFNTRIEINNDDEFAVIAAKLNQMADDIRQLIENERNSENTKNQLITSVAHDLRTPLTSIIGYLELVSEKEKLTAETKEKYIEIAYSKSKRLEKLIEDLFAYTKFSIGEVAMEVARINLVKLINQLVDEFYPSFQESNLEYEFTTNINSVYVKGDGNLLARAFANLISNAIKYGKDGKSVKIKLEAVEGKVITSVKNYGRLIPEQELQNIFERFYRLEGSRSSETGGTGLGLAIAKNIINMHGGTIGVKSDFNGTVFEVALDEEKKGMEG